MRSTLSVVATVALLAVGAVAFAATQRGKAEYTPLAASGISGEARLNQVQPDRLTVQSQIKGLEPGVEYRLQWFHNSSCTPEATVNTIDTFSANPAGMASILSKLNRQLEEIGSIAVVRTSDNSVQACGQVVQE